jgi:hypothetical protein
MAKRPVERSRRAERPEKQLFSLRLPKQLWAELSVVAKLRGKPMNELLGGVLQQWWDTQPERASVARLVKTSGTAESSRSEGEDS